MNIFHAIILGAIEGFTEFLPVSSTAHLILFGRLLNIPSSDFLTTFEIVIQFGAILAVVGIYAKRFLTDWETDKRIVVAFIPTAIVGFVLFKLIKGFFDDYSLVLWALIIGGIILIAFEALHKEKDFHEDDIRTIPYWKAFVIGCIQSIAVIPGVSRAGATIVGGMLLGIKRRAIVEFSFLLAAPTMFAAAGYDLYKDHAGITSNDLGLLAVGFIVALITAYFGVKFFLDYIKKHTFTAFGIYRIILGLAFFAFLF